MKDEHDPYTIDGVPLMPYLSVCSGIEGASAAWHSLGWTPTAFSEIEPFPSALLAHRFPTVPNLGSMLEWRSWPDLSIDLLVGGTPCQSFSVAGLRKGLDDDRGNLTLVYCEIADRFNPLSCLWENVPGVLSDKTNAFGCFLAGLAGTDAPLVPGRDGWTDAGVVVGPKRVVAWRILDAQGFVPQRRRRVFVLASRNVDRLDPVRVLFEAEADAFDCLGERAYTGPLFPEREGVRGNPAKSGEAGEGVAGCISARTQGGGGLGTDFELGGASKSLKANDGGVDREDAHTLIAAVAPTLNAAFGEKQGLDDQHIRGGAGLFVAGHFALPECGGARATGLRDRDAAGCSTTERGRLRCSALVKG